MQTKKEEKYFIGESKIDYYKELDEVAQDVAESFVKGNAISKKILRDTFIYLSNSSSITNIDFCDKFFESSFQEFISIDVEFYIARILYHVVKLKEKKWKILLKRPIEGVLPDIRIVSSDKTIAVIDINIIEWVRSNLLGGFDKELPPNSYEKLLREIREKQAKYIDVFDVKKEEVFVIMPALSVFRKEGTSFEESFSLLQSESGIENIVILSKYMEKEFIPVEQEQVTTYFEDFLNKLLGR